MSWDNLPQNFGTPQWQAEFDFKASEAEKQRQHAITMAKLTGAARPDRPEYGSMLGPDGKLQDQFVMKGGDIFNQQKALAMSEGDTPWAQAMRQQEQMATQGRYGQAGQQSNAAVSQAQNRLAMKGGLRGGAAERLASQGANQLMMAKQDIAKQSQLNQMNIGLQDYQMKQNLAGQLLPQEQNIMGQNVGTYKQEHLGKNYFDMTQYKEDMASWAAKQQGQAVRSSGGKK